MSNKQEPVKNQLETKPRLETLAIHAGIVWNLPLKQ